MSGVHVQPELTDEAFRCQLLDHPDDVLKQIKLLTPLNFPQWMHEQLCYLMDDANYDPAVAARESESGLFLDVHTTLSQLRREMELEHKVNRRLLPTAKFMVAVDGSRQSCLAFELATRLRRQGQLTVINIDDEVADSRQMPQLSDKFITEEYKAHSARLQLPANRVTISCESGDTTTKLSVAQQLLQLAEREHVDFLVLGAHGKGGPLIDQVRHVPWEVLRCTISTPTIIVPPAPVASVTSKQYVFVVAVDKSPVATRCFNAVLKLMRPVDVLRVVHFYTKPIVGEYNTQPFDWCADVIKYAQIEGRVDIQPIEQRSTVVESLQAYLSTHSATYLVIGLNGEGVDKTVQARQEPDAAIEHVVVGKDHRIGRLASGMLLSPRCTLCLCP